ncbi:hypothetical protein D5086_017204 [Populus alba]|uniref:Uncharacterized protein n=1 Tax=Populus alba TaxID=43335 RepID=A0ACC4BWM7_POPAL
MEDSTTSPLPRAVQDIPKLPHSLSVSRKKAKADHSIKSSMAKSSREIMSAKRSILFNKDGIINRQEGLGISRKSNLILRSILNLAFAEHRKTKLFDSALSLMTFSNSSPASSSCKGKSVSDMLNPRLGQIIGLENCPDQGVYPSRKKGSNSLLSMMTIKQMLNAQDPTIPFKQKKLSRTLVMLVAVLEQLPPGPNSFEA